MLDLLVVKRLREKYQGVHPLIFHRSVERAKSNGDLFDILDTLPETFPIVWCESTRRWQTAKDLYISEEFFGEME